MKLFRVAVCAAASVALAVSLLPVPLAQAAGADGASGLPETLKAQLEKRAASASADGVDGDETVTLVVELADGADEDAREAVKGQVADIMRSESRDVGIFASLAGAQPAFDADYHEVIDGFSVRIAAKHVAKVEALDGVKHAMVSHRYQLLASSGAAAGDAPAADGSLVASTYENASALQAIGADGASATGAGSVIAIIDSGLDVNHEAFSADALDADKLALTEAGVRERVAAADEFHGTGYAYVNAKIPFAYDYVRESSDVSHEEDDNHGTHVAGIAAANGGSTVRGVAPDAQILAMKVGDEDGWIDDADVLEAIDDAIALGADVMNMSFGTDAGFSSEPLLEDAYNNIIKAGVAPDAAAGNGHTSAFDNNSGEDLAYASDPDTSTVSSPSTFPAALSIASVSLPPVLRYFMLGGRELAYQLAAGGAGFSKTDSYELFDAGDGLPDDYDGGDASGKVVVVNDEVVDYEEDGEDYEIGAEFKVEIAELFGAAGVLVYSTEDAGTLEVLENGSDIPAGFVSKSTGAALRDACKAGTQVSFSPERTTPVSGGSAGISAFSSVGVAPDLQLKPELATPGDDICSSVPDNGYALMSGTSMAAPHAAGLSAALIGKLREAGIEDKTQLRARANALLMSTATPLKDANGAYGTPRKQGAGLPNLQRAASSPAYLTVEGAQAPKASAGDSAAGEWSFSFTIVNSSRTALSYQLGASVLSEVVKGGFFQQENKEYAGNGAAVTFSGDGVLDGTAFVAANASTTVRVNVKLTSECASKLLGKAQNGTFVDGYVFCKAQGGRNVDLTLPYVGFLGDWSKAPIFDASEASGKEAHASIPSYPYSTTSELPLGANPLLVGQDDDDDDGGFIIVFGSMSSKERASALAQMDERERAELVRALIARKGHGKALRAVGDGWGWNDGDDDEIEYDPDKYTIAPAAVSGGPYASLNTWTYTLRNAKKLRYTVERADGAGGASELGSYTNVVKSLSPLRFGFTTAEDYIADGLEEELPVFESSPEGTDAPQAGWYEETVTGWVDDGDDSADDSYSFKFYLDTDKPTVSETRVVYGASGDAKTGARKILRVTVQDAGFVAGVQLATTNDRALSDVVVAGSKDEGTSGGRFVSEGTDSASGKHYATFNFDYDAVVGKLGRDTTAAQDTLVVHAYDYGMNLGTGEAALPGTVKKNSIALADCTIAGIADKTYTGAPLTQSPTVSFSGMTLEAGTHYTLAYANNTDIGTARVTVTGVGTYTGSVTRSFKINPPKVSVKAAKGGKRSASVSWKKAAGNVGYQVAYRLKGAGKWTTLRAGKKTSSKLKKLKPKKRYELRVRACKTVGGTTYYGSWSATKKVKVK